MTLFVLTYTWFDRIGKWVKTSIDNLISQLFRSLLKFAYVGDTWKCKHLNSWQIYRNMFIHFRIHWWINAAPSQTPKLATRTTGRERCFLKQKNATRKKRKLGSIPQRASFVKSCMISGSPLFSRYIYTMTKAPVRGMTPTRPAVDGSFFPIAVATRMMATLRIIFSKICMNIFLFYTDSITRVK